MLALVPHAMGTFIESSENGVATIPVQFRAVCLPDHRTSQLDVLEHPV